VIVGILMAAGRSERFGSNKLLLAPPGEAPLVLQSARPLAHLQNRLAVIPPRSAELRALFRTIHFPVVEVSPRSGQTTLYPESGLTTFQPSFSRSLRAGLQASPMAAGWIIALADMPWVKVETVLAIEAALKAGAGIAACRHAGQRGNPVGFARGYWDALMALEGDEGARGLLQANAGDITWLDVDDPGILRDIDRPEDWRPD
jgi:molybdenum cofactor cytidylyltransferase